MSAVAEARREASAHKFLRRIADAESAPFKKSPVAERHLMKLAALRDAVALDVEKERGSQKQSMDAVEWRCLHSLHKITFMMLAGVDGDVNALALKDWREFTPGEASAIRHAMRGVKLALVGAQTLTRF